MEHQGTKQLETARLILRPFCLQDAESCIRNWAADRKFTAISARKRRHRAMCMMAFHRQGRLRQFGNLLLGHCGKESGTVIGEIFVDGFSARNGWCELDWKLGTAFWGNGYAAEAAKAVIRYLFDAVGFHRVQAKCSAKNAASERVMQKIGMAKEGVLHGFFSARDGGFHDVVVYGLLSKTEK